MQFFIAFYKGQNQHAGAVAFSSRILVFLKNQKRVEWGTKTPLCTAPIGLRAAVGSVAETFTPGVSRLQS
jgi:hypothetical protein